MTLANGEQLPEIDGKNLDGEPVSIADLTSGGWSVVLFYRGHW
ncbi:MAG: hypothetical protein V3V01_12770 [Acidimicrobiales bacterium]